MKHLSEPEIAVIKARIARGDKYHDIASDYRINQGRIADLKFGRIFSNVVPAKMDKRDNAITTDNDLFTQKDTSFGAR